MSKSSVTQSARNRWKAILVQLGIDEKVLNGRHHPCPVTGEGDDRFRFSNKDGKGSFFCGCNDGRGDGFQLLKCKFGMDFKAAAEVVEEIVGKVEEDEAAPQKSTERAMYDLKNIQQKLKGYGCKSEHVVPYLESRGIKAEEIPRTAMREGHINYGLRSIGITRNYHCMAVKFVSRDGKPVTYHLTYLENGKKAQIKRQRVIATPVLPMAGGAVRLYPIPEDGRIGVAEGIETAISATILTGIPTWACLNAAMLEAFDPPHGVRHVTAFADNDANFTGQAAAYMLAKRLRMKNTAKADVIVSPTVGQDFNDVLREQRNGS